MMLLRYLQAVFDVMLLRKGPQDMPSSWEGLGFLGAAYCMFNFVQLSIVADAGKAVIHALALTLLLALYLHTLLRVRGTPERFVQALSALYGVGLLLVIIMLGPTSALAPFVEAAATDPDSSAQPPAHLVLVYLAVAIWGVVAFGHIYRHALNTGLIGGIGLAIVFEFLVYLAFSATGMSN